MKSRTPALLLVTLLLLSGPAMAQSNASGSADAWRDSYALESNGRYGEAALAIEPLLRESPTHELGLMRRAWLSYLQGRHSESLRDYNQALFVNGTSLEARLGLTLPLLAQKRWSEAASEARKVLAMSAWNYTAHLRLLQAEEGEKRWDEVARHASQLVARYPSDSGFYVYLARAEAQRGNAASARMAYAKVLERAPGHEEAVRYVNQKR